MGNDPANKGGNKHEPVIEVTGLDAHLVLIRCIFTLVTLKGVAIVVV